MSAPAEKNHVIIQDQNRDKPRLIPAAGNPIPTGALVRQRRGAAMTAVAEMAPAPVLPFDAPLEVRVANLRAWQLSAQNRGERLSPILEARLTALEGIAEDERSKRAGQPFRTRFPALTKWAAEIIANRRTRTPLEVAAAYELVAVQCEEAGQWEYAARVLELAARSFDHGRRS